jgi:chromate reductase
MTTSPLNVAVFVGSLRQGSLNRRMAEALAAMAPPMLQLGIVEIGDLPLYDPDLDTGDSAPAPWKRLRERIAGADAVLFITPEYNRSVPAALKNAIDVGSRPYGQSVWNGKPGAVISVSPGAMGGFGANHHLRQSLVFLNVPVLQQPEAYIGGAEKLFDEQGGFANAGTREFLAGFLKAYEGWVRRNVAGGSAAA